MIMVIEYNSFRVSEDESLNLYHALMACKEQKATCLRFRKDIYHFREEFAAECSLCMANHGENGFKRTAFLLEHMENFEIDGGGSHFVFDSVMNMMTVLHCRHIVLRDFTVSMRGCPYPQGQVIAADEKSFDVAFSYEKELVLRKDGLWIPFKDRRELVVSNIEFNGESHEIEVGTGDHSTGISLNALSKKKIGPNTFRFFDPPRVPLVGNRLVLMIGKRYASGLFFEDSENILLQNITIHSCMGIAVMAQCCHNLTMQKCSVSSEEGQYISAGADATHFVACTGQIVIEDCLFEHMLDDALNVHGVYVKIQRAEPGRATVKFCNLATTGIPLFKLGDQVCQMNARTLIPGSVVTVSAVRRINSEMTELTFLENETLTEGFVLENLTTYPTLYFRRCTVRNNRARGVLIATRQPCVIEDCDFHTGGSAIVLECDASFWYESGAVKDLTVRGNRFDRCRHATWGKGVIYIPSRKASVFRQYYHGKITIIENTFTSCYDDVLFADNIAELTYAGNRSNGQQLLHLCNVGQAHCQNDAQMIPLATPI